MTDSASLSIAEMTAGYRDGSIAPSDVVADTIARISKFEPKLQAFEIVLEEEAMVAADAATKSMRSGHRIGPFHGIPFALKDLIDVAGLVTAGGCLSRADSVASSTATLAQRLIAGGGILIGKTKTVEVAYGAWGTNTVRGTPWNPWDLDVQRTPGGSSSGSGVSVAMGLSACAVGTDTGGSVRIPAAWCGIVGLKVTEGRLPLDGIIPLSHTLDTPGPMSRTVRDAVIMFETMDGRHPVDIETDMLTGRGLFAALDEGVAGLRLGVLSSTERGGIEPAVLAQYDNAVDRLKALGAEIVPFDLPAPSEDLRDGTGMIISCEGYYHHGEMYETPSNRVDEDVKPRILAGKEVSARDFIAMMRRREANREQVLDAMRGIAAYLTPTVAMPPQIISTLDQTRTPARFTRIVNYLRFCAMSVPMGVVDGEGPTALQIIARDYEESMAVRIASAYERDRGPFPLPFMAR
ncbi:MAG: amidase [Hyphomicrobiaceae bacterium]